MRPQTSPPRLLCALAALLSVLWAAASPSLASAAELAVLDLDGFGVPFEDAAMAAQGLRDALTLDGRHRVLTAFEASERLTYGHEGELDRARELARDGRGALDAGRYARALELLSEAQGLHIDAGSELARRAELADVYTYVGLALLGLGTPDGATDAFSEALRLYPGYLDTRAPELPQQARGLFERAEEDRLAGPRHTRSLSELSAISRTLGVELLVAGYVDAQGLIAFRLVDRGELAAELEARPQELPPFPGDPLYGDWASELLYGAAPASSPSAAPRAPAPERPRPADDLADLDDIIDERSAQREGRAPKRAEDDAPTARRSGRSAEGRRWWIWAVGGAAVAGGAVAAVVVSQPDGGAAAQEPAPRYTVSVEKSASRVGGLN